MSVEDRPDEETSENGTEELEQDVCNAQLPGEASCVSSKHEGECHRGVEVTSRNACAKDQKDKEANEEADDVATGSETLVEAGKESRSDHFKNEDHDGLLDSRFEIVTFVGRDHLFID